MIELTETGTKDTPDSFINALIKIAEEATTQRRTVWQERRGQGSEGLGVTKDAGYVKDMICIPKTESLGE